MSRRTKLLIAALFLVLLGIPVVYVVFHWHPPNPLRFTIDASQPAPRGRPRAGISPFYVTVENTSDTPIVLFSGDVRDVAHRSGLETPIGSFSPGVPFESDPANPDGGWLIPPRGRVRCAVTTLPGSGLRDFQEGDKTVRYIWNSRIKLRVSNGIAQVAFRASSLFGEDNWLWELIPDPGDDFTPLLPAPPSAAAAASPSAPGSSIQPHRE